MNTLKTQKTLVLAKIEAVYGTASAPAAADVIQAENVKLTPLAAETAEQNIMRPYMGGSPKLLYDFHVMLEFDVAMSASGAAGTPPPYGSLMRIARLSETIDVTVGSESVIYAPVSGLCESATIHTYIDGQKHAMTGARGSVSLKIEKGIPYWSFKIMGVHNPALSENPPAVDDSAWISPEVISFENTGTAQLLAQDVVLVSLNIDDGLNMKNFNLPNYAEIDSIERSVTGKAVFFAPAISEFNWFAASKNTTFGALNLVHGTAAGKTISHTCPKVQILNPTYGDSDGVRTIECDLNILPLVGNDEWQITFN